MKKNLWMLGMAVVALASCTQSEVLDTPERPNIGFESFVGKQTRATADFENVAGNMLVGATGATNDLRDFWVFASHTEDGTSTEYPFEGSATDHVFWDAINNTFTYNSLRQWYLGSYQFFAYSDGNNKIGVGDENDPLKVDVNYANKTITFKDYVNNGNNDLVASIPAPIVKNTSNISERVALTFDHMLSCVELSFTNNSSNFYLDFQQIQFNALSEGDCVYNTASTPAVSWTPNNSSSCIYDLKSNVYIPGDQEFGNPDVLLKPGVTATLHGFVIPQSNEDVQLTFYIVTYEKVATGEIDPETGNPLYEYDYRSTDRYEATLEIPATGSFVGHQEWKPGYVYRYTADVTGSMHYINFNVTAVTTWDQTLPPSSMSPAKNNN